MKPTLKIGTRESQLAVWQATLVQNLLHERGFSSELVFIKSEGDINTVTPLYELGVQGIFTKTLDAAILNNKIDIAVHSMKDVPTLLAEGIKQAAVLKRGSYKDVFVYKNDKEFLEDRNSAGIIATSSIRRKAQWLHRYPNHSFDTLRGNINTRMRKVYENDWKGAIFAAAGLERINLRPENSIDLDWMLPAPSQGAIMIICRDNDDIAFEACRLLNDSDTALCTKIEKDFLRVLMGGCSTPISALAVMKEDNIFFQGNILSLDGKEKAEIEYTVPVTQTENLGTVAAQQLLTQGGDKIIVAIRNA